MIDPSDAVIQARRWRYVFRVKMGSAADWVGRRLSCPAFWVSFTKLGPFGSPWTLSRRTARDASVTGGTPLTAGTYLDSSNKIRTSTKFSPRKMVHHHHVHC